MDTLLYIIAFAVSIWIIAKKPISKLLDQNGVWDYIVSTIGILLFVLHLTSTYLLPKLMFEETANLPCGPASPQGLCYTLKQEVCENAWNSFHETCKIERADEIKAKGPSGLVGPIITKCKAQKLDKIFKFNRTQSSSIICGAYFNYIESE